ncbi:hypothetical protein [Thalassotalea profundi]|uniref:Outer membrane lipoprotein-sorting protein n=1 Tax=Thalassotalea profundi TaxID=2036687 RepID=A0ABQ3IVN7_9GAMM|nr:hypothetical protein [Thalassotalea profundi]GHE96149.1 hypothetical protein GCM10011501_27230 [Thalassotalea profundi]
MKKSLIFLITIISQINSFSLNAAETCFENLGAIYNITNSVLNTEHHKNNSIDEGTTFELWRKGNELLHITPQKEMTIKWHKLINGDVRKVNFFDQYERGIEFEPIKISKENWQLKQQLVSDKQIEKMTLSATKGKGCERTEHYQLKNETTSIDLWWFPSLKLAQKIIYTDKNNSTTWLLKNKIVSKDTIANVFNKNEHYQMTDYADIGDNESDPFLRKMIHLGFVAHGNSGFYDAQGNQLSTKHQH